MIDLVDEGVDVAVRITWQLAGAGLCAKAGRRSHRPLRGSRLPRAQGNARAPEDLVQHDCLVYSLLKEATEWRFRAGKRSFAVPIEARFSAASGAVLRSAALAGMGLAVLPRFMIAADLDAGRLRPVVDSFEGVELGIYAVYPNLRTGGRRPRCAHSSTYWSPTFAPSPSRTQRAIDGERAAALDRDDRRQRRDQQVVFESFRPGGQLAEPVHEESCRRVREDRAGHDVGDAGRGEAAAQPGDEEDRRDQLRDDRERRERRRKSSVPVIQPSVPEKP